VPFWPKGKKPHSDNRTYQAQYENFVQAVEPTSVAFFTWKLTSGGWGERTS
jgi:hypothetical protein